MKQEQEHIPEHTRGKKTDTVESVQFDTIEEAKQHYLTCRNRLLNVSNWQDLSGKGTARFDLTDSKGNEVHRLAEKGDHFKIDIPAPGSVAGEGNDWVRIEKIDNQSNPNAQEEFIAIHVRPCRNPQNSDKEVAHFFKSDSTSTFLVRRNGNTVSAEVHGRNESPNTEDTGVIDTIRNAVVAVGAMLGFSELQWKQLVKGIIADSSS
jgi:hypothetical protein